MGDMRSVLYYTRKNEEISCSRALQQLLSELVAQGYYLATPEDDRDVRHVRKTLPGEQGSLSTWNGKEGSPGNVAPGVSERLQAQVECYRTVNLEKIAVNSYAVTSTGPRKHFTFSIILDRQESILSLNYNNIFYDLEDREGVQLYEHWLMIVQRIYTIWHPYYGYEIDHHGFYDQTGWEDILSLTISHLYETNLFGPELVQSIGRERLETAPAQMIRALDDGGLMLIPRSDLYPGIAPYRWRIIADHLGLTIPDDLCDNDYEDER